MKHSLLRLYAMVTKELRQLRRDKLTFAMIVGMPVLLVLLFGFAMNNDVRYINAALLDEAQTSNSRELVAEINQSQIFTFKYQVATQKEVEALFRAGRISAALVIPVDFERRLAQTDQSAVQLMVDGSDQSVQGSARQLVTMPINTILREHKSSNLNPPVALLNLYNPQHRAPLNSIPGLIGIILTMSMVMFTSEALVRERERGNLEFLITTPLSPAELILGKVLPLIGIGLIQTALIIALGVFIFDVPVRGSLGQLFVAALFYIFASVGLGIFISTTVQTQFQAMQMSIFTFLPQLMLSGYQFPFAGMPRAAQWIGECMPLTHIVRLVRGIMLRSSEFMDMWPDYLALFVFGILLLTIAILRFRKRLD
jgi:ABC-2 type transport system permease protein